MKTISISNFFLVLLLIFGISSFVSAQSDATLKGSVVTDLNDAKLSGALVTIVQIRRSVQTDANGNFEIPNVPAGNYTILVHLEGFSDAVQSVKIASNTTLAFKLKIAQLKEEVTVTASGVEQTTFDAVQSVNSVGATAIAQRANTSLGEVLDGETGVAKRSFGAGSARPVIRGFDGDRVLIAQDGVRISSLGSQSGDHGEPLDPLSAERIEIVKGPATLLYGSNAIGGVVNAVTQEDDRHDGLRGFFTAFGGTNAGQGGYASGFEFGKNDFVFRANSGGQRNGAYQTPIGKVQNSGTRSNSNSFNLGYFGDKAFFNGGYSYDFRNYGIPYAALFEVKKKEGELPFVEEEIDLRMKTHTAKFSGGWRDLNAPITSAKFNFSYTDYQHKELEGAEVGTVFDNKVSFYRGVFEQKPLKRLTGRFGFEGFNRKYETVGAEQLIDGEVKQNNFAVFGLQELNFKRVKLQFGGRVENNRYRPANTDLIERDFTGFSGAIGARFDVWQGGAISANYTNSFRAPALEELYNFGPHIGTVTFEIGNEDLKRERANGIDFSFRQISNNVRFNVDVFNYNLRNFVYLAPQDEDGDGIIDIEDGLPVAAYSQANSRFFGGEASLDITVNRYFGVFFGGDFVRAKLTADNVNLPRIPPARARAGIELRYKGLTVRPEGIFARDQDKIFPLETRTAGYGLFNLSGSYVFTKEKYAHIIFFNAFNLNDKLYRNHLSFIKDIVPEAGRGLRVGYTIRFF